LGSIPVTLAIIGGAIILVLLGVFLWKKGNQQERFLEALIDVIFDFFTLQLPVFFSFRAWAVFLWLIGFVILIVEVISIVK
jgi:hypothetical protein